MKKIFCNFFFLTLLFWVLFPVPVYAWNMTGHTIIAQIAFDHLTDKAKQQINYLLGAESDDQRSNKILSASIWPDLIKKDDVHAFDHWHFIDIPFSVDQTPLPSIAKENVVWAINQSILVVASPRASHYEKKLFLRFLIHFVGDITQPLHCATRVSKQYPKGDAGGVLFPIMSMQWPSLHSFWDAGAGYFSQQIGNDHHLRFWQIRLLADAIQKKYPETYFGSQLSDMNPAAWAQQSFTIAKTFAYDTTPGAMLSPTYIAHAQQLSQQQIALAGYRLANLLNLIFSK